MTTNAPTAPPPKTKPAPASRLAGKNPAEAAPSRCKMLLYGPPGCGKTYFACSWPAVYLIDCEGGGNLPQYTHLLAGGGGSYCGPEDGALDLDFLADQMGYLCTEKHGFKTVVIDSISKAFNAAVQGEAERLGSRDAFGASKKPAIRLQNRLLLLAAQADVNVIFIAHEKAVWGQDGQGQRTEIDRGPDVYEKVPYDLNLICRVKHGLAGRTATVQKSRLMAFEANDTFPLEFGEFQRRFMSSLAAPAAVIQRASPHALAQLAHYFDMLKVPQDEQDKWLAKASASVWADISAEHAQKLISYYEKKTAAPKTEEKP